MEARLKEIIRSIVKEIQSEEELEEMSVTGGVAGYDTPAAFSKPGQTAKKNKRLAKATGGTVVNTLSEMESDYALGHIPVSKDEFLPMKKVAAKDVDGC